MCLDLGWEGEVCKPGKRQIGTRSVLCNPQVSLHNLDAFHLVQRNDTGGVFHEMPMCLKMCVSIHNGAEGK